jgi:hypothetical protein
MADTTEHSSNSWLAFVVGALLVGLLVLGYMMFTGRTAAPDNSRDLNLRIETPDLPRPAMPTPAPAPTAPAQ